MSSALAGAVFTLSHRGSPHPLLIHVFVWFELLHLDFVSIWKLLFNIAFFLNIRHFPPPPPDTGDCLVTRPKILSFFQSKHSSEREKAMKKR